MLADQGFLVILFALLVGHAICDYSLQGDFLARAKDHTKPFDGVPHEWPMAMHCIIHSGAVYLVTGMPFLAAAEFVMHWVTDRAKCSRIISFSHDQLLHVVGKVVWAAVTTYVGIHHG